MLAGKTKQEIETDGVCFACPITDLYRLVLSVGPDSSVFCRCEELGGVAVDNYTRAHKSIL